MICKNCSHQTDETKTGYCDNCKLPLGEGVYAPPEGYAYNPDNKLYYQQSQGFDTETGSAVLRVIWFNPVDGSYNKVSYPCNAQQEKSEEEQSQAKETAAQEASEPAAGTLSDNVTQLVSQEEQLSCAPVNDQSQLLEPPPEPEIVLAAASIPAGFLLDEATGLYYRADNTAAGWSVTWFDSGANKYFQDDFACQSPAPQPPQGAASNGAKQNMPAKKGKKKKGLIIFIILLVLALAAGFAIWYFKLYEYLPVFGGSSSSSAPQSTPAPQSTHVPKSAPASSKPKEREMREISPPEDLELIVKPTSKTSAFFEVYGVEFKDYYPAYAPDVKENDVLYSWQFQIQGEKTYTYIIDYFYEGAKEGETISIEDMNFGIYRRDGNRTIAYEEGNDFITLYEDAFILELELAEDSGVDFTSDSTIYSLVVVNADTRYGTTIYTEIVPVREEMPGDYTGYVPNEEFFYGTNYFEHIPNGKWMSEDGKTAAYLSYQPTSEGEKIFNVIIATHDPSGQLVVLECAAECTLDDGDRFAFQKYNDDYNGVFMAVGQNSLRMNFDINDITYESAVFNNVWNYDEYESAEQTQ